MSKHDYTFKISLTVLDHLGRSLYRNFATIIGEAISNAWDADATLVNILYDPEAETLTITDDGIGMNENSFQNKFLKIGFSKRTEGANSPIYKRPYIGRKGIGKLALLSSCESITIITKTSDEELTGGTISNQKLDISISDDSDTEEYILDSLETETLEALAPNTFTHGTVLHMQGFKANRLNTEEHLRTVLTLYFRFSLIDPNFLIVFNGKDISYRDLDSLTLKTEFIWRIGDVTDRYIKLLSRVCKESKSITPEFQATGFIASVCTPRDLSIHGLGERVTVDLFVNGRVRERNILRHIPTSRVAENYLYGQIHFDSLEGDVDRFTSSREGVVADDPLFKEFLEKVGGIVRTIINDWDKLRRKHRKSGDSESDDIPLRTRKAEELSNIISVDYLPPKGMPNHDLVDQWITEITPDATFNAESYIDCFFSENLVRKLIEKRGTELSKDAKTQIEEYVKNESNSKNNANISFELRENPSELSYLNLAQLANFIDKVDKNREAGLNRDAISYKPVRDACAHTARLSQNAKTHLQLVFTNIRERIRTLLREEH